MAEISENTENKDRGAELNGISHPKQRTLSLCFFIESFDTIEMKHINLYHENKDDMGIASTQPSGGSGTNIPSRPSSKFQFTPGKKYISSSPVKKFERFSHQSS